jgi:hypothetical protein
MTRLADMTPEELRAEYERFGVSLHALIKRATREARDGCVDQAVSEARSAVAEARRFPWAKFSALECAVADAVLSCDTHITQEQADTVEREFADLREAFRLYLAASPMEAAPSVTGDIARATERMTRIAQISRKLAEVSQLPDDYTAAEDFECAEAALLALATGGGR